MRSPVADEFPAFPEEPVAEPYRLDVYLVDGQLVDVRLDGESVYPTWFKLEFKESGEVSAKVKGVRLSSRGGDEIRVHQGYPVDERETATNPPSPVAGAS